MPTQHSPEQLANLLRELCKLPKETEFYQLSASAFEVTPDHSRVLLFGDKDFKGMDKEDRIRACYLHCCLKYVNREPMNNTSLRERFAVDVKNSTMVSRIINKSVEVGINIRIHFDVFAPMLGSF